MLLAQITGPAKDKGYQSQERLAGKQSFIRSHAHEPKVRKPERASALMHRVFLYI